MSNGFAVGALIGGAVVWWLVSPNDPQPALHNAELQILDAFALEKAGSGQVALVHGFVDDFEVCHGIAAYLGSQGGMYDCTIAAMVERLPDQ